MEKIKLCLMLFLAGYGADAISEILPASVRLDQEVVNQKEQEKNQKKTLRPSYKKAAVKDDDLSSELVIPEETECWKISEIDIQTPTKNIDLGFLEPLKKQVQGRCVGVKGVRNIAVAIQNRVIKKGYITTKVSVPAQDINAGKLLFSVTPGIVNNVQFVSGSGSYTSLFNTLPLSKGDLITLSALERGSENLQRVDGSQAKIYIQPLGDGESDLLIERAQKKYWKVSGWANDAGSRSLGRYQSGGAFYLLNPTSLNDTFYVSYAQNVPTVSRKHRGYQNYSLYYSVPLQFWSLDLFYSKSKTQQTLQGNYGNWAYENNYRYRSVQLNRLLRYNTQQRLTASVQLFDNSQNAAIEDVELTQQEKRSSGWKASINQQLTVNNNTTLNTVLSYQQKTHWFGVTPEERNHYISNRGRIVSLNMDGGVNFSLLNQSMTYAPKLQIQYSPDKLSSLDQLSLGNRWTVRGFDGQQSLMRDKGWFMQHELRWNIPSIGHQIYASIDGGQVFGQNVQPYNRNTLIGSVVGIRGWRWNVGYDFFAGVPLLKPDQFATDNINLGFTLQWQY